MIKTLILISKINSSGNGFSINRRKKYICTGTCSACSFRFQCFTDRRPITLDWDELRKEHKGSSPFKILKGLVGGKVFVAGSKKFYDYKRVGRSFYLGSSNQVGHLVLNQKILVRI